MARRTSADGPLAPGARLIAAAPAGILFEAFARPLLVAHAAVGLATLATSTHLSAAALRVARRGHGRAQLRRASLLSPLAIAAQVLLGLSLYPTYRVRVRLEDLARSAPRVVQLFDFKEHLAALALGLVCAGALSARAAGARADQPEDRGALWAAAALSASGAVLAWAAALIGFYVASRHRVGAP